MAKERQGKEVFSFSNSFTLRCSIAPLVCRNLTYPFSLYSPRKPVLKPWLLWMTREVSLVFGVMGWSDHVLDMCQLLVVMMLSMVTDNQLAMDTSKVSPVYSIHMSYIIHTKKDHK